ncbi:MAG: hypothetical protein QNJ17_09545 [Desulfocapsaceae bacterium]|nr:hypothetical protein [Desulfocapsaceae bacterium]
MRFGKGCASSTLILMIIFFGFSPAFAKSAGNNDKLEEMIVELEEKIDQADRKMIAHPTFLEELRQLTGKYRAQLRELFFRDGFEDGDFTQNPVWVVKSGEFRVNESNRLTSAVQTNTFGSPSQNQSSPERSLETEAVGILLDSIFGPQKSQAPTQEQSAEKQPAAQPASIYTRKMFPPAYELKMNFRAPQSGIMELILLGTEELMPRYRLKIRTDHSDNYPMEVVRERSGRSFIVGASEKFPVIDDGQPHSLTWVRHTNGAMNVIIDNEVVLETYEVYYRDDFKGLEVVNNGGIFEWDSFEIYKPLAQEAQ